MVCSGDCTELSAAGGVTLRDAPMPPDPTEPDALDERKSPKAASKMKQDINVTAVKMARL